MIGVASSLLSSCGKQDLTATMVEEAIIEEIPNGSKYNEVLKFLDSHTFGRHKFEHDEYITEAEAISFLKKYSNVDDKPKKLGDRLVGYISAATDAVDRGVGASTYIVAHFYFDKDGRLIDHTVKEVVGK
jgi:hypothetical protein